VCPPGIQAYEPASSGRHTDLPLHLKRFHQGGHRGKIILNFFSVFSVVINYHVLEIRRLLFIHKMNIVKGY